MPAKAPFVYRSFWDVPRFLVVTYREQRFLFECEFDDNLDDYPDAYRVFLLRDISEAELAGSWVHLSDKAQAYLGEVPVKDVHFDPTLRREIETDVLERLLAQAPRELAGAARP